MFNKILIANRGEIACRIIKTTQRLGIQTVAVYSTADSQALHTRMADEAIYIGESAANASYLDGNKIIQAALKSGAEAIHPGYGFLSENSAFATACTQAGIVFIGPSIEALEIMGSKQLAKQLLEKTNVPLTPGYHGKTQDDETLLKEAKRLGFPVLLKAAAGGGGKGMRSVMNESEFTDALAGARREAKASFADDTMLIERLVHNPRHVEIQIMADNHGQVVHLFERDCSIQRRHQKIIEEAPAPNLSKTLRQDLANAAIEVAKRIAYRGAGTIEFLVENNEHFYFMEMNTRLQVEHPVTEMITGLDLVEWQLRIAANEPLPCTQADIHCHGHAIECRIYAEDPNQGFMPSIGQIHFLREPQNAGIRIDSGIVCGAQITQYYDPMIAKLISFGSTREQALQRLQSALKQYHIGGVKSNIAFLQAILHHPKFIQAQLSTGFLTQETLEFQTPDLALIAQLAAGIDYLTTIDHLTGIAKQTIGWQMHLRSQSTRHYLIQGQHFSLALFPENHQQWQTQLDDISAQWHGEIRADQQLVVRNADETWSCYFERCNNQIRLYTAWGPMIVESPSTWDSMDQAHEIAGQLTAPMPATIVAVLKSKGDVIKAGDKLMVLEAMKMEHTIHAPHDGRLIDICFEVGAQVNEGAELMVVETV